MQAYYIGSEVYEDAKTGLMWQDNKTSQFTLKDWEGAKAFCRKLSLNGYKNWRLPSIKEFETILGKGPRNNDIKKGFKYIGATGYYWTNNAHDSYDAFAWMMNFKRGYAYNNYKTYKRHIRCVRGKQIIKHFQ